jgi:hypothetical protein
MGNYILVHNHDNGAESIISEELFTTLQYMFSKNSTYRYLTEQEENDYLQRMELTKVCQ